MQKWEYLVVEAVPFDIDKFRVKLAELGDAGWELIAIAFVSQFYFKRPKS